MLSVNTKPKKRVRFSPDIIFEYNTTYTIDQDTTSLRVTCEEHQLESHLSFLEEENFNTLSLYEDFYDSYQYISEYGNFTVAPQYEQDIYMISHMDLASDKEIKIDMKSISIDTVTTSCDDNDFSTVAYPSRALPYYSPDTTAGLSLKKKFARNIYFKSRYVWCDPIGRSINWFVISIFELHLPYTFYSNVSLFFKGLELLLCVEHRTSLSD